MINNFNEKDKKEQERNFWMIKKKRNNNNQGGIWFEWSHNGFFRSVQAD